MMNRTSVLRRGLAPLAAFVFLVATGCGNLTPGGIGTATVVVSGDAPETAAAGSASHAAAPRPTGPLPTDHDDEDQPEGEVQVEFELFLIDGAGAVVQLGEEIEVQVDLQGETEADVVREAIPAERYDRLRIVFIQIEAEVDAGLVINGDTVTGPVEVDIEEPLLVERDLDLIVAGGAEVEVVIDLNAPAWLRAVDPETATVDPSVFADLLAVVTR